MVVTRGLLLLRAWWATGSAICAFVVAMNSCCHQAAVAKCRLDSREALMALVWLFASGVAVDQLLVDGGSLPRYPAGLTLPLSEGPLSLPTGGDPN